MRKSDGGERVNEERSVGRAKEDTDTPVVPTAGCGGRKRARGSALPPEPRCGPIAIRKEAFFMGAARSAGLCDKN